MKAHKTRMRVIVLLMAVILSLNMFPATAFAETSGETPQAEAIEKPNAEEPKAEEAQVEETLAEEPKAEEPKTEEPKAEEPKDEEPKAEEPKAEEPKAEESQAEGPIAETPQAGEPKAEEPQTVEPTTEPTVTPTTEPATESSATPTTEPTTEPTTATTYTVTFDVNGHGIAPATVTVNQGATISEPAAPSEEGYTFTGWYKDAAATEKWDFSADKVSENTTLYAGWSKTVQAAMRGAPADAPSTDTTSEPTATITTEAMPTQAANRAVYNETKTFSGPAAVGGSLYWSFGPDFTTDDGDRFQLYSIESVDYNAQIGLTVTESDKKIVVSGTPTARFNGALCVLTCKTGALGTNTLILTLQIKIQTPPYYVNFDSNVPANASTACTGSMDEQDFWYDEAKALSANGYSLPGYNFTGWNTEADGSGTPYADQAEVQGLTTESGSTVTLYAQWSAKPYTIEYWSDDSGSQKHVQTAYFDRTGRLDTYSDRAFGWDSDGKALCGWTVVGSGSYLVDGGEFLNLCGAPDANGNVADPVIIADWGENGYFNVTLSASPAAGGTVTGGGTYVSGTSVTVTATPADGYTFVNWTENGSAVSTNASYSFTVTGDCELVAVFKDLNKQNIDLSIYVPDKVYGEAVECIVYASVDGEYTLLIDDGKAFYITVSNNLDNYYLGVLDVGDHRVTVSFSGNDDYNPASAEDTFTVSSTGTPFEITASTSESIYGETVTITHTLPDDAYGTIKYFLNDGTFLGEMDVRESLDLPTRLDTGTWVVIAQYPGDLNHGSATDTTLITIRPAKLTINGVTASDKVYDGTDTAMIGTSSATMSGFVSGDGDPNHYFSRITFAGTFEDANVGSGKPVTVTATLPAGTRNYVLESVNSPTASITKRTLTITANDQEYTYNGQIQGEGDTAYEDPAEIAEKVTVKGLQGSDALTSVVLDGQGIDIGDYDLVPSNATVGEATGNYDIIYVPGKLKIKSNSHTVTVKGGKADKETAAEGETVTIKANDPEYGMCWVQWSLNDDSISYEHTDYMETTFVMPDHDVSIEAVYAAINLKQLDSATYTGNPITPKFGLFGVSLQGVGGIYQEGIDYDISYEKNVNAGTATATVTFKDHWKGTKSTTFTIWPAYINSAKVEGKDQVYAGTELVPEATVTWNGRTLEEDKDYTVAADGIHVGERTVTVTGKGNFEGTTTGTFNITRRPLTVTVIEQTYGYDGHQQGEGDTAYEDPAEIAEKIEIGKLAAADAVTSIVLDGAETDAGEYDGRIEVTGITIGENTADYNITSVPGRLTITPRTVTITVDDASKVRGEEDPAFTGTVEGLVREGDLGEVTYYRTDTDEAAGIYEGVLDARYTASKNYYVSVEKGGFTIKELYTMTWLDGDGSVLESKDYTEDDPVLAYTGRDPVKTPTAQYSYVFTGWDDGMVEGTTTTFRPLFKETLNKYSVTFVNYDSKTVLKEAVSYDYGTPASDITLPDDPKREADVQYTYTFTGWTPEITDVTADAVYTAVYSSNKQNYTITWLQDDGTQIDQTTVEYGKTPVHTDPTKAADKEYTYTFSGWDPEVTEVTGDATYKATYTKEPIPAKKGILTFDLAGGTLDGKTGKITIEANVGDTIKLPGAPVRKGYTFQYWKGSKYEAGAEYTVEGDHTFTAVWEEDKAKTFIVTFDANGHGSTPDTQTVEAGKTAAKPKDPTASGYTFGGWYTDKECKKAFDFNTVITMDVTLYAKWTKDSTSAPSTPERNAENGSSGTTNYSSDNTSAVKTGDNSQIGLWIVLMAVSLLSLVLVVSKKKSLTND